jgi:hypothetical protein
MLYTKYSMNIMELLNFYASISMFITKYQR